MVFQDPYASLDPRLRVAPIVREPLVAQGIGTRKAQNDRVRDLLSRVGIPASAMDQYPHQFSGGQRQRIAIARSLAVSPDLVVADEPTSALDVSIQSQVLNLMRTLQREKQDLTYIVISHDLAAVRYLADRVGVMYLGKLVELGEARDVYENPAHPYTSGLLGAIPEVAASLGDAQVEPTVRGELPSAVRSSVRLPVSHALSQGASGVLPGGAAASGSAQCQSRCGVPLPDRRPAASSGARGLSLKSCHAGVIRQRGVAHFARGDPETLRLKIREKCAASLNPQRKAMSVTDPPFGIWRSSRQRRSRALRTINATDSSPSSNRACNAASESAKARAIDVGPRSGSCRCART